MSEAARLETEMAAGQRRKSNWILAGLWMVLAAMVHLLLLRTRLSDERNEYGIVAGVLCVVGVGAYFFNAFLGPKGSTWALLLAITGGLMCCVVIYDAAFLRYVKKTHYVLGNFRKVYQTKHAPL